MRGQKAEELMEMLGHIAETYVFMTDEIYKMEVAESRILSFLMEKFVAAAVRVGDPEQKMDSIDRRMLAFVSDNYKKAYVRQSGEKTWWEAIPADPSCDRLHLWYDRQLRKKTVSGVDCKSVA